MYSFNLTARGAIAWSINFNEHPAHGLRDVCEFFAEFPKLKIN